MNLTSVDCCRGRGGEGTHTGNGGLFSVNRALRELRGDCQMRRAPPTEALIGSPAPLSAIALERGWEWTERLLRDPGLARLLHFLPPQGRSRPGLRRNPQRSVSIGPPRRLRKAAPHPLPTTTCVCGGGGDGGGVWVRGQGPGGCGGVPLFPAFVWVLRGGGACEA